MNISQVLTLIDKYLKKTYIGYEGLTHTISKGDSEVITVHTRCGDKIINIDHRTLMVVLNPAEAILQEVCMTLDAMGMEKREFSKDKPSLKGNLIRRGEW